MKTITYCAVLLSLVISNVMADLIRYDNFNDATHSESLWVVDTNGNATVTFTGSNVVLAATSGGSKRARIIANFMQCQLEEVGDSFQMVFDMKIVWGKYGFICGASVGSGTGDDNRITWGQYNNCNNNNEQKAKAVIKGAPECRSSEIMRFDTMCHYDTAVTLTNAVDGIVSVVMTVYEYNSEWGSSPEMYRTSTDAVVIHTLETSDTLTLNDAHAVVFANTKFDGTNDGTSPQDRGSLHIDNVYSSTSEAPLPATVLIIL